ncbi:MAG TPA: MOSC N-terminal beta barrel domain-containing protein [Streptosporangiaceae bacterium]
MDYQVDQLWRYPVKSVGGEQVAASIVDSRGLLGDRLWAVQDADGKLGSGKDSRRFRRMVGLLGLTARYAAEPGDDGIEPPVVAGPDGTQYPVSTGAADEFLRDHTGMPHVRVRRECDVTHFDEVQLSIIGSATLAWLQAQLPEVRIEIRRFRSNVVVRTAEPLIEESWIGRTVSFGTGDDAVQAVFDRVLQRCVMVGMGQPGLSESSTVLKRLGLREDHPVCLALGGLVARTGTVRVGDLVKLD